MNRIVEFSQTQYSLSDPETGEPMHSRIGPMEEAALVYVSQCGLKERLLSPEPEPLVLWDLGLGIAANSVAAIACYESLDNPRPLEIYSVERDLSAIRIALGDQERFSYLRGFESAVEALLQEKVFESPRGWRWTLVEGEFAQKLGFLPTPEVIFYDFYSPKTNPEAWDVPTFEAIFRKCQPRLARGRKTVLSTYCAASCARRSMRAAGFLVSSGTPTRAKRETTLATSL